MSTENAIDIFFKLLAVLVLVGINGFFVAAEFSLVTVRRTRIDQLVAEGNLLAKTVRKATNNPDSFIAATQLGITMSSLGLGWIGEPALARLLVPWLSFLPVPLSRIGAHSIAVGIAFALITALHIILGELAPKTIALQNAEKTALFVVKPTEAFLTLFRPFIWFLNGAGNLAVKALGLKAPPRHRLVHSEEELKMLVTASTEAGVLEKDEQEMIHRVFAFSDLSAGQVMVPRTEMISFPLDIDPEELVRIAGEKGYSRYPIYDQTPDRMVGIIHLKDLLRALLMSDTKPFNIREIFKEPLFVPESMRVDDVLARMKAHKKHIAIVIDEYGGTSGLVTLGDLLEKIFGEVQDEFVEDETEIERFPDGTVRLSGLLLIQDINDRFGFHIVDPDNDTIGGYVLSQLGRRPQVGDRVEVDGYQFLVESLDGFRIAKLRVVKKTPDPGIGESDFRKDF